MCITDTFLTKTKTLICFACGAHGRNNVYNLYLFDTKTKHTNYFSYEAGSVQMCITGTFSINVYNWHLFDAKKHLIFFACGGQYRNIYIWHYLANKNWKFKKQQQYLMTANMKFVTRRFRKICNFEKIWDLAGVAISLLGFSPQFQNLNYRVLCEKKNKKFVKF